MEAFGRSVLSVLVIAAVTACSDMTPLEVGDAGLHSESPVSQAGSAADPTTSSVHWLSDLSDVEGATAQLTRTTSGASYSFRTTGLDAGHVVTMWWVIFNVPSECEHPVDEIGAACGLEDLSNPDVQASVMGGDGHIVGASGRSTHAGHLREGEISTYHPDFVGSPGIIDAMEAEIHLVLRTHGPMIPGMIDEMRSTFEAACTPESSNGHGNGPNECADLQAAAFSAP